MSLEQLNCPETTIPKDVFYAISILPQDKDGQELYNAISSFFSSFKIGNLLRKYNAQIEKGVPVLDIFRYKLCNVFSGCSRYLLSVNVMVGKDQKIPAKIVCVRNKKNRKDWIAFICTNPDLSEDEIIRIYEKRWQIEVFFKTCKIYLNLITECHSLSYDALTAHTVIVLPDI